VIAADGRQSALATSLGLLRQRMAPRRWAIGAYFEESRPAQPLGEMHIRKGRYIGVSPLSDRVSNVCLVKPSGPADPDVRRAEATLRRELSANPELSDRFAGARLVRPPIVLGPLAADPTGHAIDGVIVAGDAAGFIDPMTGDGLRFAVRGGELAASASLDALAHGWTGVHTRLAGERRREFGAKWRFNRALRGAVSSHPLLDSASLGARLAPWLVRAIIRYAGDCGLAATTAQTRELEIANCRLQI
jgi:flavin-dependent dehydrogenase